MQSEILRAAERLLSAPAGEVTQELVCMGQECARFVADLAASVTPEYVEAWKRMSEYERAADAGEGLLEWEGQPDDMMDLVRFALPIIDKLRESK